MNLKKFFREYFLVTLKRPEPVKVHFKLKDMLFYVRFVKPFWKPALAGFLLMLVSAGISSISPLGGKVLIDNVLQKKDAADILSILSSLGLQGLSPFVEKILGSLNLVVIAGLVIGLLMGILSILQSVVNFHFNTGVTFKVQTELFDRILRYPLSIFKEKQTGYLMSRLTGDVSAVQSFFSQYLFQFARTLLTPIFSFFILFHLNRRMTFLVLAIVPVNVLINYLVMVRTRSLSYRQMEKNADISGDIQQALAGIEVVKSYGAEDREKTKVSGKMREVIELQLQGLLLSSFAGYVLQALNLGSRLLITWLCGREVLRGAMSIGDLTSFTLYSLQLTGQLGGIFNQVLSLQYLFLSMGRLHEMFSIAPEISERGQSAGLLSPPGIHGRLQFRNVGFAYPNGPPVLKNVSLDIRPGEKIAVMGASGIGKTTLISLVLKFYRPQRGKIVLDGRDLERLDTEWLRSRTAIVSQETFLFNDTLENNIKYGRPDAGFAEVEDAARKAQIHEDILRMERGYHTPVGERGARLSIGQKQRISLARAFLKNPAILILDEPTSALDRRTEKSLGEALRLITRGRTTILITHRLPLLDIADRVFEFKAKGLTEVKKTTKRRAIPARRKRESRA
ncbi:MAG: ABC transporter ATP-binding protein [Candidatus Aminicenantes bacterium]|nr:ABC transporter ATP-binding protein [Candidatus Aminicenantes bacterium]